MNACWLKNENLSTNNFIFLIGHIVPGEICISTSIVDLIAH